MSRNIINNELMQLNDEGIRSWDDAALFSSDFDSSKLYKKGCVMRTLYSGMISCPANCAYCFSKWMGSEKAVFPKWNAFTVRDDCIIYPCCDSNFLLQKNLLDQLLNVVKREGRWFFSFSTKHSIHGSFLNKLSTINRWMMEHDKGFIKIGISVTTKTMVSEIEPGSSVYEERVRMAKELQEAGIPTALILKPVLPFISDEEYNEIIDDFSTTVSKVLLGGLYISRDTKFYRAYQLNQYAAIWRRVNWVPGKPYWEYIEEPKKNKAIRNSALVRNMEVFDSDVNLMTSFIKERQS